MESFYHFSVITLQILIGTATGISLLHFAVILVARATGDDVVAKPPTRPLRTIFLVPALNEELVIEKSVRRLLAVPGEATVVVIDDGSTDGTADTLNRMAAEEHRVRMIQRVAPNARQGKGEALNHAYRLLRSECLRDGIDPASMIICVMDADGLVNTHALTHVSGLFGHDEVGAVQIGVRIINRNSLLGRLQDIEFFMYCRIFQQGRNNLGSTGLGGNGQFNRLSALISLGDAPWTKCLTEDLDLGLQMILKGWRLIFTDQAYVHQQGLVSPRRLIRQRARWVQGYFQCWRRIPQIMTMPGRWYTVVDLLYCLCWPAVSCLVMPLALVLSWMVLAWNVATISLPISTWLEVLGSGYLLAYSSSYVMAWMYRSRSGDMTFREMLVLVHGIGLFQFVWGLAGWRALGNILRGEGGWAKTERVATATTAPGTLGH